MGEREETEAEWGAKREAEGLLEERAEREEDAEVKEEAEKVADEAAMAENRG